MAKKAAAAQTTETAGATAPTGPVALRYVGPADVDSPRYGPLVPGRCYQETDPDFAAYLATTHPDHWVRA